jgi:hypothetical protein
MHDGWRFSYERKIHSAERKYYYNDQTFYDMSFHKLMIVLTCREEKKFIVFGY